jgi:hypothetical protein
MDYAKQTILKHKTLARIATAVYKWKYTVDIIKVALQIVLGTAPLFLD